MTHSVHARALQRAAEILGGKDKLRELLRVSLRELEPWLAGAERPPMAIFLKAVDVISAPAMQRARSLRRKSEEAVARATTARERALAVQRALLARKADPVLSPNRVVAQTFLSTDYVPAEACIMVDTALDAAISATGADMGNVQLSCPEGLRIVAHRGFERPFLDFFVVVDDRSAASCGEAKKTGRRIVVPDVPSDPIFVGTAAEEVMAKASVRSVQSTPLVGQSGQLLGMLNTHSSARGAFKPEEQVLDHIARRTAFWLEGGSL